MKKGFVVLAIFGAMITSVSAQADTRALPDSECVKAQQSKQLGEWTVEIQGKLVIRNFELAGSIEAYNAVELREPICVIGVDKDKGTLFRRDNVDEVQLAWGLTGTRGATYKEVRVRGNIATAESVGSQYMSEYSYMLKAPAFMVTSGILWK